MCRLDFVFLPQDWKSFDVVSYVDHNIDLTLMRHDHFVVVTEVSMVRPASRRQTGSATRIDVRKCQDPSAVTQFLSEVAHFPTIPWHIGVGLHAELLTEWIQKGVKKHFAADRTLPRQRYMSQHTWHIVTLRKQLGLMFRKAVTHRKDIQKRLYLDRWFRAFQAKTHRQVPSQSASAVSALHQCERLLVKQSLWTLHHRRQLHPLARAASRQDRLEVIQNITDEFHQAARSTDSSALYRSLRPLLGQANRKKTQAFSPVPAVRLEDGALAATQAEASERWRQHFAQPEQGHATTVQELQNSLVHTHAQHAGIPLPLDFQAIPTKQEIEEYIMRARRRKSPGVDGIPGDVYKLDPQLFATVLWPLLAKVSIRCQEPLRWKGGEVCSLPKTSMISHSVDKYRSILLADFSSKIYHGVVRQKLLSPFAEYRKPMQAGGVPRLGTDMLNLFVQVQAQHTRSCGLSSAALYVDIRHAFYSVCRPLLIDCPCHESQLAAFFASKQWNPDMFQDFIAQIHGKSALSQAKVSPHLAAQVQSMLTATWFEMKSMPATLTATQAGAKPGDSIADLLFAYLMTRFLSMIEDQFQANGLCAAHPLTWLPPGSLHTEEQVLETIHAAAWVDDLVILLEAGSPVVMLQKVRTAMQIAFDSAVSLGLDLNLSKDKTSVLLALRGPQARAVWSEILAPDPSKPVLAFQCKALTTTATIAIVPDYLYLGSLHDHSGTPAVDVKRKFLFIQAIRKVLRKGVFKSHKLPVRTKCQLFQSLLMSRMTFSVGAWQRMHMHTARSWQTQLVNLYSQIHPQFSHGPHVHNLDIVAGTWQMHPMMILASARLQLYDRVMQTEMAPLFALLQAQSRQSSDSWLDLICQDIASLSQFVAAPTIEQLAIGRQHADLAQQSFQHPRLLSKFANRCKARYQQYGEIWLAFRQHCL